MFQILYHLRQVDPYLLLRIVFIPMKEYYIGYFKTFRGYFILILLMGPKIDSFRPVHLN